MAITVWSGRSLLDPSTEICLHITGLDKPSNNRKTGPMVQTWIMCKAEHPALARSQGLDAAICGTCPHRAGSCYVTLAHAPSAIFKHAIPVNTYGYGALLVRHKAVRLGAYGDPAAVPYEVWDQMLKLAHSWTGYTHQWRTCDQRLKRYCMASVDSIEERGEAHDLGWRTFRVAAPGTHGVKGETLCAAADGNIVKMQCIECGICSGHAGRGTADVYIHAHGSKGVLRAYEHTFQASPQVPGVQSGRATGVLAQSVLEPGEPTKAAGLLSRLGGSTSKDGHRSSMLSGVANGAEQN